jgi:hypothetical protein
VKRLLFLTFLDHPQSFPADDVKNFLAGLLKTHQKF